MTAHVVCIMPGPNACLDSGRRAKRWCFRCRTMVLHRGVWLYDEPLSWYDPHLEWVCSSCHEDHTRFPGA